MSTELNFDKMVEKYNSLKNANQPIYLKRGETLCSNIIEFNVSESPWDGFKSAEVIFQGSNGRMYTIVRDDEYFEILSEYEYLIEQKKIIENRLCEIDKKISQTPLPN